MSCGGAWLIQRLKPLVLFEYNFVSKKYFDVKTIKEILGRTYTIFRLRKDAMLDSHVENAWNCLAIPQGSEFEEILRSRIVD